MTPEELEIEQKDAARQKAPVTQVYLLEVLLTEDLITNSI